MAATTCPFCHKEYQYFQAFKKHIYKTHSYGDPALKAAALSEAAAKAGKTKKDQSDTKNGERDKTPEEERRHLVKIAEASTGKSAAANSSYFDEVVDLRSPSGSPASSPPPTGWSHKHASNDNAHEEPSPLAHRRPAWATGETTPSASPAMKERAAKDKGKGKERPNSSPYMPVKAHGRGKKAPATELSLLSDSDEDELESIIVPKFSSATTGLNKNSKRPSSPTLERNSVRSPKVIKLGRHANATEPARASELDRGDQLLSDRAVSDLVRDNKGPDASRQGAETSDSDRDEDSDEEGQVANDGNILPLLVDPPSPAESDFQSFHYEPAGSPRYSESEESEDDDERVRNGKYDHAKAASVPNSVTSTPTSPPMRDQFERFMSHALRNKARGEGRPSVEPAQVASSSTLPSAPSPFASTPLDNAAPRLKTKAHAAPKQSSPQKYPMHTSTPPGAAPTPHNSSSPLVGEAALPTVPPPPQCDALACPSCHAMAHAFHVFHTTHSQWRCEARP